MLTDAQQQLLQHKQCELSYFQRALKAYSSSYRPFLRTFSGTVCRNWFLHLCSLLLLLLQLMLKR
jgi:hypothetical protein